MAIDRNIQLRVSLSNGELLRILRDRSGRAVSSTFQSSSSLRTRSATSRRRSDVTANFDPVLGSVTLSGAIGKRHPFRFTLKPETRTYENFLRLFLRELQSVAAVGAIAESVALGTDAAKAVRQLTRHLEARLQDLSSAAGKSVVATDFPVSGADFVEVFSSDLELMAESPKRDTAANSTSVLGNGENREKRFSIVEQDPVSPRHISGFLSLEIDEPHEVLSEEEQQRRIEGMLLESEVYLLGDPVVRTSGRSVEFEAELRVPPELRPLIECGVHWGEYGAGSHWCDEEIPPSGILTTADDRIKIRKRINTTGPGSFGAVLWVATIHGAPRKWLSTGNGDLQFHTDASATENEVEGARARLTEQTAMRGTLLRAIGSFESFLAAAPKLISGTSRRHVYRELYHLTSADASLRQLLSEYFQRIIVALEARPRGVESRRLHAAHLLLKNLGIGEVVFVAPEGPHAIAGGLAQVIVGLSQALSRKGIATTIVSPLYEEALGAKHRSAAEIVESGVEIHGHRVMLRDMGEIRIPFGPVMAAGSHEVVTPPRVCVATVYSAEYDAVRMIFLRHRRLADRLYAGADSDDQLRRALFLSRGALEVLRDPRFGVLPHIVITNDWLSALVPVLLRVDERYRNDPVLKDVENIHVLHNCGRDYQGRFFTNHFGMDLFPMLGIDGEHYFGISDPVNTAMLNLTAGAIFHAGRGIVAVSKPYADQLLTDEGGECLQHLFRRKANALFGISNGIDVQALQTIFSEIGERARCELDLPALRSKRFDKPHAVRTVEAYKSATKTFVQRKYGLQEDPSALLITLVGRLTEQKGIQLLSGCPSGETRSVMELLLLKFPNAQILIGGPPSPGDPAMENFATEIAALEVRYPGRVKAILSFIQHRDALEMTLASDLFLMPSRFEPGGITQLEALASGTIVVARRVGGLAATLIDAHQNREHGNSFLFSDFTPEALSRALHRAATALADGQRCQLLRKQALLAENDWSHRAPKYIGVLQQVAGVLSGSVYPYLSARRHLLASVRAGGR